MQDATTITVEAYRQALLELAAEDGISDTQREWLRAHYNAPEQVITAAQLAKVAGYERHSGVNRWYGELGKQVAEKVGYQPPPGWTFLSTFVTFDKEASPFPMRLRPNFAQALELLGWVRPGGAAPVPEINLSRLHDYYRAFVAYVEQQEGGQKFTSFAHRYIDREEKYKYRLREEALTILDVPNWKESDIGSGRLIERMIEAIEKPEGSNLVQSRQWRFSEESRYHRSLYEAKEDHARKVEYERLLFQFFHYQIEDRQAMARFIDLAGRKYSFIAYFYFLKDDRQYAPIAPSNFEEIFSKLGVDFKLSGKCSWQNYDVYNQLVGRVRDFLSDQLQIGVTLLDAHSFLWILQKVPVPITPGALVPARRCTTRAASASTSARPPSSPVEIDFEALQKERSRIGRRGEDYVIEYERQALRQAGKPNLAKLVERITDHTLGFDVRSWAPDGAEKQIEVKTISGDGNARTFFLTQNELNKSTELENYYLYFVIGISDPAPQIYYIHKPDYQDGVSFQMEPVNYRVTVEIRPTEAG